jgi:CheY-like chemotaxis protein
MSELPGRRTVQTPQTPAKPNDAPQGTAPDGASASDADLDERSRTRRLEFARMLLGAVERRGSRDAPSTSPKSVRPEPGAPARVDRPAAVRGGDAAKQTGAAKGGHAATPKPMGEASGAKVLVIDDDQVIRDMVGRVLARENLVYQAPDGASGLALLKQIGPIDVIVCDVMMPHMDGFEFAKAAKADPHLSSIPILFLTARESAKDQLEGIRVGARSYLTKPFKVKDLMLAVQRAARSNTAKR